MFLLRGKTFHGTKKERAYIDNWTNILWESEISELFIKNNVMIMLMKTDKDLCECLIACQSEK